MLCLHCVLFAVLTVTSLVSADHTYNLLTIEAVVTGRFTLIHFTGVIYKMMYLDILETSFIINLGILAAATYAVRHAEKPEKQATDTYISVGIAFAIFAGILVYHMYQQVWPNCSKEIQHHKEQQSEGLRKQVLITKRKLPL